jgi:uncharacterized membrane protein
VLALSLLALALRVVPVVRDELWADEIFSLAMATGHSLEHPAVQANAALGDYVETSAGQHRSYYDRYVSHEQPPAGGWRVLRAVFLSDTNPPVYYLLLNIWTRALGTGDVALRSFSVLWAVLTVPLLWLVAREVGDEGVAWSASIFFTFSPVSIYYSAEGRMYSLLWFVGTLLVWLTLMVARRGPRLPLWLGWTTVGAAGLLVHYFFAFVWLACACWLLARPGLVSRAWVAVTSTASILIALPWFVRVPESLGRWRVTAGWLEGQPLSPWQAVTAPVMLAWDLLAWRPLRGGPAWLTSLVAIACLAIVLMFGHRHLRSLFAGGAGLIWLWLLGPCVGPVVFDLMMQTYASAVLRYALAGLPAVLVLIALGLGLLPRLLRTTLIVLMVAVWLPAIAVIYAPRWWVGYRAAGASLDRWAGPSDLIIVHSIPSGVIALARYLHSDAPIASWVVQLATRGGPEDLESLLRGRGKVAMVKIADLGKANPAEPWLREHAALAGEERPGSGHLLYFVPRHGATILSGRRPDVP